MLFEFDTAADGVAGGNTAIDLLGTDPASTATALGNQAITHTVGEPDFYVAGMNGGAGADCLGWRRLRLGLWLHACGVLWFRATPLVLIRSKALSESLRPSSALGVTARHVVHPGPPGAERSFPNDLHPRRRIPDEGAS